MLDMSWWGLPQHPILLPHRFFMVGITETIATNAEVIDGQYTGKVINIACYQKGKLAHLEQWLQGRNVEGYRRGCWSAPR